MKILGDELIFFKSLAKDVWNWSLEHRNFTFSISFIKSSSKSFKSGIEGGDLLDEAYIFEITHHLQMIPIRMKQTVVVFWGKTKNYITLYLYGIEHCLCFVNQKLKLYIYIYLELYIHPYTVIIIFIDLDILCCYC
jgi:hypothetical protein